MYGMKKMEKIKAKSENLDFWDEDELVLKKK